MTASTSPASNAEQRFLDGYSCSESVASIFATHFGLPEEPLRRAACGFGGGMGGMGRTCGAATGAIMAIGMALAPDDPTNAAARSQVKNAVRTFLQEFEERHGSSHCKQLLGCDLSTPEGYNEARSRNLFKTICPSFVLTAGELLEQLLDK
ncbi:C-GCAxxG-C-C family protein [Desulfovibrio ferrophilus]|uniref:C_GCAxxG_C_C family protein n=1 Tax=Desulfovibrio ferrophilus TaxID=241368 RepID=A0A2Z6B391_9BACT|nr:C-GCAxxG-C-C family protein [Desulfovibrio ferrophilus]BBD09933.1 C_GCAxxG_C_C family protein [Desulfovibrio ferrophilus]